MYFLFAIVLLPVIYGIVEYIQELNFRRLQKKHNCAAPNYISSFPLGIPNTLRLLNAVLADNMHPYSQQYMVSVERKTNRLQTVSRTLITTIEPENLKAVLASQFKDFDLGERYFQFRPLLGDGIFTLSGHGWQHSRAMLRPQFTNEQISRLQTLEQSVQDLIGCIREGSAGGQLFDVQKLFFKLTLDTATEFLFGESTDSLSGGKRLTAERAKAAADFQSAFDLGQDYLLRRSLAQKFYWLVTGPSFYRAQNTCKSFVDYYVQLALQEAKQEKQAPQDESEGREFVFLKELVKETQDPIIMRDQALNILLAGRDTTAGLLSFTMSLLVRHKEVWKKLRTAILTDFGTGTDNIDFHTLKRCEYLKFVINEVLRLFPIVPVNFRQATRDTTLPVGGGPNQDQPIFVPKGTMVHYHTYSLHRCPDYWGPDAEEFKPERWADIKGSQVSWKYIPFNGGPRICIGQQFALTEAAYVVVRLLQTFEDINTSAEIVNSEIKQRSNLTSTVAGGVHVNFTDAKY